MLKNQDTRKLVCDFICEAGPALLFGDTDRGDIK